MRSRPTEAGCYWVLIRLGVAMVPDFNAGRLRDFGRIFTQVNFEGQDKEIIYEHA